MRQQKHLRSASYCNSYLRLYIHCQMFCLAPRHGTVMSGGLQMREKLSEAMLSGFGSDPEFIQRSLATLNSEAVAQCKTGDHVAAVVAFCKLFERAKRKNLIHPEMHVCYR